MCSRALFLSLFFILFLFPVPCYLFHVLRYQILVLCSLFSSLISVHWYLFIDLFSLISVHCSLFIVLSSFFFVHCFLFIVLFSVLSLVPFPIFYFLPVTVTVPCSLFNSLFSVLYSLFSVHCFLNSVLLFYSILSSLCLVPDPIYFFIFVVLYKLQ